MNSRFIVLACAFGLTAVIFGAFGAHGLKSHLDADRLASFETGVRYQMFHALALFAVAWLCTVLSGPLPAAAGWCFTAGTILFSGSIYLLACRSLLGIESWKWLGPITPLGGLLLIIGWSLLLVASLRAKT
jgi:uncharacterized membrane protein YgdD (TMEM256/DUF423 family)